MVRWSIYVVIFSMKELLNFSIFCSGMGLKILSIDVSIGGMDFSNRIFFGMLRHIRK
jgi:hypothetical protein